MTRRWWSLAAILFTGAALYAVVPRSDALAQQPVPVIKQEPCVAIASVDGKENFGAYCAVCHGRDAKGNGPAAPALKMPVPDLTTIAIRRGKFDFFTVENAIVGRDKVPAAHGTVDMPMWGPLFRATSDPAVAKLRTTNLVKYLESIQKTS